MLDILAVIVLILLLILIAYLPFEEILRKAGVFLAIGGGFAIMQILLYCVFSISHIDIPSYIQRILNDWTPGIWKIIYYLSSIALGLFFVIKAGKISSKRSVFLFFSALIFFIFTAINTFFSFLSTTMIILISSISLVIGTIKQQITLHSLS